MGLFGRTRAWAVLAVVVVGAAACATEDSGSEPRTLASTAGELSECIVASDCGDGDVCTTDRCIAGLCAYVPVSAPACCNIADDCEGGSACKTTTCVTKPGRPYGTCGYAAVPGCCSADSGCDDRDPCTADACNLESNTCTHSPIEGCCVSPADCSDENGCTVDRCVANQCVFKVRTTGGCCASDEHCDDNDPCTANTCDMDAHACESTTLDPSGKPICCQSGEDCDDGDACTNDICDAGACGHTAVDCDDQDACTEDSCAPATGCDHAPICSDPEVLLINEVDYDQPSTDTAEFLEIYNPGPAVATLSRWKLQHVNGSNNTVVWTLNLTDAAATLPVGGYLVVGVDAVLAALPGGTPSISQPGNFLQNGAPDGVRLLLDDVFFDGVAYEGTMEGTGEGTTAPSDIGDGSLSRCPNGADTDDNGADFKLVPTMTPGAPNMCEPPPTTFAAVSPIFQAKCGGCHTGGGSGQHNMGSSNVAAGYTDSQKASYYTPGATKGFAALVRIQEGSMPLGGGCSGDPVTDAAKPNCLTAPEQATIQAWLDGGQLAP